MTLNCSFVLIFMLSSTPHKPVFRQDFLANKSIYLSNLSPFPHPIQWIHLFFPLHMTKPSQSVSLQNTTHLLQLVHLIESSPTPLSHTKQGRAPNSSIVSKSSPPVITSVFPTLTLRPFFSILFFHLTSFCFNSFSTIRTRSSAYESSLETTSVNLETAMSVGNTIVSNWLNYANSLPFGISCSNMLKLQRVQNSLMQIVLTPIVGML